MAVYTEVSDEELSAFVSEYDIGEVIACKGIAEGVENSNFLLQTDRNSYILTLYEKRVDPKDLPFFVDLMEHLARSGIACPTPIKGRDGKTLRWLCNRPAAIVSFLHGFWPRRIESIHCGQLGQGMARMHQAGLSFMQERVNNLSVNGWRPLFDESLARAAEIKEGLATELADELDFLEENWPQKLSKGVIHADLFPDNVFFLDGKLSGIIDFYFACTDFLAYDVAICLNAWCFEADGSFNLTKGQKLLNGYQAVRSLEQDEVETLPILCRGAAMRFLLTRLYDWLNTPPGAFVKRKDPLEYLEKLRFHRSVRSSSAYGLTL